MKLRVAIVSALALAAVTPSAMAQGLGYGGDTEQGHYRYGTPIQALPSPFSHGGSCVQWCVADTSPCDPDYYKVTDRRCNINHNGYFSK